MVWSGFKYVDCLPALTEVSRYELFGDVLCPQSGWWCLDKRLGWRPFRRLPWSTTLFSPNYIELGPSLWCVLSWLRSSSGKKPLGEKRSCISVHFCTTWKSVFAPRLKAGASKMTPNNLLLGGIASRTTHAPYTRSSSSLCINYLKDVSIAIVDITFVSSPCIAKKLDLGTPLCSSSSISSTKIIYSDNCNIT